MENQRQSIATSIYFNFNSHSKERKKVNLQKQTQNVFNENFVQTDEMIYL